MPRSSSKDFREKVSLVQVFFWGDDFVILQGFLRNMDVETWFLGGEFVVGLW
jgi:hypothetical protein